MSVAIEKPIAQVTTLLKQLAVGGSDQYLRWLSIRLLEGDFLARQLLPKNIDVACVQPILKSFEVEQQESADVIIADARYEFIAKLTKACVQVGSKSRRTVTQVLDSVLMHRWLGIPIFLLIMYCMFEISMNVGTLLQPLFDISSTTIFINGVSYYGHLLGFPNWFVALLSHGIGLGINTVVNFIPQIGLLFLCLAFLEDSGYMARAAFVMDRLMQAVGLPGKSFVPLIVGFGCNVPSIMATRTLATRRDRIMTCLMAPFMSCGARLAIFVVFVSAFFPQHGGLMIFLLYVIGIVVAMLTGLLMKLTLLRKETAPFVLELPVYHVPNVKTIGLLAWQRLRGFIMRAGRLIIPICVIIGTLNAIQLNGTIKPEGGANSLLAQVGRVLTPVFEPMGIQKNNWPATVGLFTGTMAKEVVVGTLNTLYTQPQVQHGSPKQFSMQAGLKAALDTTIAGFGQAASGHMLNPFTANEADHRMSRSAMGQMALAFGGSLAAFSYLLFVLLYIPCVSTMSVLTREIGRGWAWLSTLWSVNVAYFVSALVYQIGSWHLHVTQSISVVVLLLVIQGVIIFGLRASGVRYGKIA